MEEHSPGIKDVFEKGIGSIESARVAIKAYLQAFKSRDEESLTFNRDARKVFNDVDLMSPTVLNNVFRTVSELFRYGEEVHITKNEEIYEAEMRHFRKDNQKDINSYAHHGMVNPSGKRVDLHRTLLVALLQEAGVWNDLVDNPEFDSSSMVFIDQNDVAFFRRCIRAASKYFYVYPGYSFPRDLREETLLLQRSKRGY